MASAEQEILEEQQEILQEVKEIKNEVKSPSVARKLFRGALAGAVLGTAWQYRSGVAGLGKSLVGRR